jgi:hypothetical protein
MATKKTKEQKESAPMLNIGASRSTVAEARAAINDILAAPHVDNNTKVEALRALNSVCAVNGASIMNCQFTSSGTVE